MATREELYDALRNADKAGDAEGARKLAAYIQSLPAEGTPASAAPTGEQPGKLESFGAGLGKGFGQVVLNAQKYAGKGVEALGGIGQTDLATPDRGNLVQRAGRWLQQDANEGLQRIGNEVAPYKAANPITTGAGEIGGQIVATAPVGGLIAGAAARVPGVAAAAPNLLQSIRTAGMSTGGATGIANPLLRAAGGAINGGVSAALVDPEAAGSGAVIGAALPGAIQLAGAGGRAVGRTMRGPEQAADVAEAVQAARASGYVIPPTQARPTLGNRLLEGFSGKLTTAQNASAKNQAVTNAKAARALGLADDVKITPEVLDEVRSTAGQAYREVANLPVRPAVRGDSLTNTPASSEINPAQMVFDLRQARNDATAWYASYGRTASPEALEKAKTASSLASKLETGLEDYAKSVGREDLVPAMVEARRLIAKSYSVEKALNPATGSVDARKLASQLQKGKPLSGDLKDAAEFAARFPKAAQVVEGMGSLPQTSPLDWALGGATSAATSNPLLLASVAARPAARALSLSPVVQNRLVQPANQLQAITVPEYLRRIGYQAAPLVGSDR